jgi:hypothetical protein
LQAEIQFGEQQTPHLLGGVGAADAASACAPRRLSKRDSSRPATVASSARSCAPTTCSITVSSSASLASADERSASVERRRRRSGTICVSIASWHFV